MHIKNSLLCFTFILTGMIFSHATLASCNRNDIDHYLQKGFTPIQITQICSSTGSSTSKTDTTHNSSTETSLSSTHTDNKRKSEKERISFLRSAIAAAELDFRDDSLSYVTRECIEYDSLSLRRTIGGKKFCGFIRTTIAYQNLSIVNSTFNLKDTWPFGKPTVSAKGDFQKELLDTEKLNNMTKHERQLLIDTLKEMKSTKIPVQDNFSLLRVKEELQKLSS